MEDFDPESLKKESWREAYLQFLDSLNQMSQDLDDEKLSQLKEAVRDFMVEISLINVEDVNIVRNTERKLKAQLAQKLEPIFSAVPINSKLWKTLPAWLRVIAENDMY